MSNRTRITQLINVIFLPLRFILSHELLNRLGLCSLRDERNDMVMKYCKGKIIDIGCGNNQLVKKYGNGVGVDVYDFGGDATIVRDSSNLPFEDKTFDTVCFVASLQHIPHRERTIKEAYRILSDNGLILITILNPIFGFIRHKLAWWDKDQHERGMKQGEKDGLTNREIYRLMNGFTFIKKQRFLGINNLYIFKK